jgi:hypothetical protein
MYVIYLFLTVIGVTLGSSTVHIHAQTEYREQNIHNNEKKQIWGKCGPCPVFVGYTLEFAVQQEKAQKNVRVVEKCPDIPVAVVQYTFTPKQYTEWNIHT